MIKRIDTPFDDIPPDDEKIIPDTSPFFPEETEFLPEEYFTDYQPEENEVEPDIITQCRDFFSGNGPLKNADFGSRKAEERPQQLAMATAIAEALVNGDNLCIEAPTGVGKSFAYLVPLIYRSKYCRRPSVISTETITLQEQLIEKDLPKLAELTGIQFKAALAKGRRNYLCRRRFELLSGDQRDALLPNPSMLLDVERLNRVLARGGDGTRDGLGFSLDGNVWNLVCCESGNCLGAKCPFYRNCYYYKARREWEEADIIVANHALFFTDLAMHGALENAETEGSLLPNYGAVMIDEAHTLENNAAEYLGLHISRAGLVGMLNRLYNPDSAKGLLMRPGTGVLELRAAAASARDEAYGFFTPYENYLVERKETAA
ncbi:MAG: DEAD/DEAH box helicase, partial [Lentisphaeria bacterium]|nr:DEAD/DEAH box helicase [Lentisphaeria bacterium]